MRMVLCGSSHFLIYLFTSLKFRYDYWTLPWVTGKLEEDIIPSKDNREVRQPTLHPTQM